MRNGRKYTRTIAVLFTDAQYDRIKAIAEAEDRPVASLVRLWVLERAAGGGAA